MGSRSHYLPRNLDKLSDHDRAMVLDVHLRDLETEIQGIKEGSIYGRGGKQYLLKLANARLRRLVGTANDYGLWLDDDRQRDGLDQASYEAMRNIEGALQQQDETMRNIEGALRRMDEAMRNIEGILGMPNVVEAR